MQIQGKHVVVTGGASGIGKAMCQRFAAEGARAVVVADLDESGARSVADAIGGQTAAMAVAVDVGNEAQVRATIDAARQKNGPIDLYCGNAGIGFTGGVEQDNDKWQKIWDVNVMANVYAARAVLPSMIERGDGYIVITASAAGLLSQIGSAPYAVTKHAAVSLAEWLAISHGDQGIKVSVLCPQAVRTPMIEDTELRAIAAVDGIIEPEQVADCVVQAIAEERFLIAPHAQVLDYIKHKAADYDRWIRSMRRLQARILGTT